MPILRNSEEKRTCLRARSAVDAAQLIVCLSLMMKPWVPFPTLHKPHMVVHTVLPALGIWELEDQKLKVILNSVGNLRLAWATWESVSK